MVGVGWTVGSAISSSAKREAGRRGRPLGERVLACELGWRENCAWTASRGPKSRGRVVALHREPAAPTTEPEHRRQQRRWEPVGDGTLAVLAGSTVGGLPERVPLTMFTGAGDDGGPASSRALFLEERAGGTGIEAAVA